MFPLMRFSLSKKERLCSDKEISELFAKGKRFSFTVKGNTLQCVYLVNMSDVAVSEPLSSPAAVSEPLSSPAVVSEPLSSPAPLFAPSRIFISVPKRNLKRAVDRNRVKRLIREGYRLQKNMLSLCNKQFNIAFVYQGSANVPFGDVRSMIKSFFDKILSNETRS